MNEPVGQEAYNALRARIEEIKASNARLEWERAMRLQREQHAADRLCGMMKDILLPTRRGMMTAEYQLRGDGPEPRTTVWLLEEVWDEDIEETQYTLLLAVELECPNNLLTVYYLDGEQVDYPVVLTMLTAIVRRHGVLP